MGVELINRDGAHGPGIQISSRRGLLWPAVASVWCIGWLLYAAMDVSAIWRQRSGESIRWSYWVFQFLISSAYAWQQIVWMTISRLSVYRLIHWLAGGIIAWHAVRWVAAGRPETITVDGGVLTVTKGRGRFRRTDHLSVADIRNVRRLPVLTFPGLAALMGFWSTGRGRVAIDLSGITYRCATGLSRHDAEQVVEELRRQLNVGTASKRRPLAEIPFWFIVPRRILGWLATFVTLYMLAAGIVSPAGAVIGDFSTCTNGIFKSAYQPFDLRGVAREGVVSFVPFDDFSLKTAESLAEHYRKKYDVPIQVQPAVEIPESAYDPERGQVNSSELLAVLEQRYQPGSQRHVVISLTDYDMYSPDLPWAYTYSMRRGDRLAVVSTARMRYGCLGFSRATPERQLGRLRKMIGKDLGLLYFRLAQSTNPASMLYRNIGGPQDLDRMTEEF